MAQRRLTRRWVLQLLLMLTIWPSYRINGVDSRAREHPWKEASFYSVRLDCTPDTCRIVSRLAVHVREACQDAVFTNSWTTNSQSPFAQSTECRFVSAIVLCTDRVRNLIQRWCLQRAGSWGRQLLSPWQGIWMVPCHKVINHTTISIKNTVRKRLSKENPFLWRYDRRWLCHLLKSWTEP